MTKVLITGVAGFVGFHLAKQLSADFDVYGIDRIGVGQGIQSDRLKELGSSIHYRQIDILDAKDIEEYFSDLQPKLVVHLAACAGIAGSVKFPEQYFQTNVDGFYNVLKAATANSCKLIYASSSSIYNNQKAVFSEQDRVDDQLSFYGATKKINEVLATNYAEQFGLQCIGLRFFTVYGSWTRTDMAAWKFMQALMRGEKIRLYNNGEVQRDFTHVSDIVQAVNLLINKLLQDEIVSLPSIYNIGNGRPVKVADYLAAIANRLQKKPIIETPPLPENELSYTHANTRKLEKEINYTPQTTIEEGVEEMVKWFEKYYSTVQHDKI